MSANELRDTPGRLLLGWAVLFSALVVLAWRIHLHPADYEWTEYPTALGDSAFYMQLGPDDDRYEPNLKFAGQEKGLFRRVEGTVEMDDAVLFKIAKENSGRCFVYKPVTAGREAEPPVYLKAADGRYVEFGVKQILQAVCAACPLRRRVADCMAGGFPVNGSAMVRPRKEYTVRDLQLLKGKRVLTHIHVKSPQEAAAAEAAGVDLMSCSFDSPEAQARLPQLVAAAPNSFLSGSAPHGMATQEEAIRTG